MSFIKHLAEMFDEPALTMHWHVEGRQDYTVLAFVPGSRPFDLFDPARTGRAKLYVRHVLITDDAEVLPRWLRFVRLVVDLADLPLNVSRETIQESPVFVAIKKGVTNRVLQELVKLAESDKEKFAKVWEHFGAVLKEGLYEDPERRDALFGLARFRDLALIRTAAASLKDYLADLQPNQTAIYYLLGEDLARLSASPQLEGFRATRDRGLALGGPGGCVLGGDGGWFRRQAFQIGDPGRGRHQIDSAEGETGRGRGRGRDAGGQSCDALRADEASSWAKSVEDVRASERLSASPACLVASDRGPDRRLERMLAASGRLGAASKPVLEINPGHPLIRALAANIGAPDKERFEDVIWLLFDEARVMEGEKPADAFAARLTRVLIDAVGRAAP